MGYSARIKIDSKRVKKDGTAMIYLQVIINRRKAKIDLGIAWPPGRFHLLDGCRPRKKNDPDYEQYNVVIGNARTQANNIYKDYLIRGLHITLESFLKEYRSNLNKNDFIQYFAQKSFERWSRGKIGEKTYAKEKGTLKVLRSFAAILPFHEFTPDWAHDFDKFMKKKGNDHNTRWSRHKNVTTYLNMARDEDKINFTDPYMRFTNKLVESSWGPLELGQMKILIEWYLEWRHKPLPLLQRKKGVNQKDLRKGFTYPEVVVLRRFLFSCNNALRISDLQKLDESLFDDGQMSITPHKTERHGTKIESVPLNDVARLMLDDEIEDMKQVRMKDPLVRIFSRYTDQAANRLLKRIAEKMELGINLHNHVARYTFGSLMDQAGANHTGLMKYMGILKRETLEKYVKTNRKVIAADIEKMNKMVNLENQLNP